MIDFQGGKPSFVLVIGPFRFSLKTELHDVITNIGLLYSEFDIEKDGAQHFNDFHVSIAAPNLIRRFFHAQAQFYLDGEIVFNPFPLMHATAMLEWGMNWCVSTRIHTYLIIHAAVIEKDGLAAVMPAQPGSGKSTLTAALVQEGWRLLSDELTLIDLDTFHAIPMPRPIGLKNESIDIIKRRYPDVIMGIVSSDTLKGSVSHLKPPTASVLNQHVTCPIGWIIFPKFELGAPTELSKYSKGRAFMEIANNAFNYSVLGVEGFDILKSVVDRADCFSFRYSNLDEAIDVFDQLEAPREV